MEMTSKRIRSVSWDRETEYRTLRSFVKQLECPHDRLETLMAAAVQRELTARQRQMVRMYYIEQLPMREIASQLGLNPSTVTRTLQAARIKLRACMQYGGRALLSSAGEETWF